MVSVQVGETTASMYLGFYSETLPTNNITDYMIRVVKPQLDALEGVQEAEILGGRQFALRAWLDPVRMAAHGVTAADVSNALAANNYLAAIGATKGDAVTVSLTAATDLHTVGEFRKLAVKSEGGAIVRLEDVANVVLGSEDYDSFVAFDGKQSVFVGIKTSPDANVLDVAERVRDADLVITGEGQTDAQTLYGKLPLGIAHLARSYSVPCVCLSGALGLGYQSLYEQGMIGIFSSADRAMSFQMALQTGSEKLEALAFSLTKFMDGIRK